VGTAKRERQKQGRQARLDAARVQQQRKKRWKMVRNVAIFVVALVGVLFLLARQDDDGDTVEAADSTSTTAAGATEFVYGTGECPEPDGSSPQTLTFADAPQLCIDPEQNYTAVFDTSEGEIAVALDAISTPGTTNNFVTLSRFHYYDATNLFRTNTGIGIIQGGSPHTNDPSDPGPGYNLPDEGFDYAAIGGVGGPYTYGPGDLVMARSSQPDGAGAQFFFGVTEAVSALDQQGVYVKFGEVREGQEVLDKILALHQGAADQPDEGGPSRTVTVNSITIEES
jgi:peptidyl-prolyl cis-trans isomerase B (cyclophilin B)